MTPTSAHRQPRVHIPPDLATATHVFIRRGGVQPTLASPYEGPFRVASKTASGFKVHLPGRGIEEIALARIKPALVDEDPHNDSLDLDEEVPPSPPPPGRRPGIRTRIPEPTDRQTRAQQQAQQRTQAPEQADPPIQDEGVPSTSNSKTPTEQVDHPVPQDDPAPIHRFTKESERRFSKQQPRASAPQDNPAPSAPSAEPPAKPIHRFTMESERRFSKQRPRINLNSLTDLIFDHLDS